MSEKILIPLTAFKNIDNTTAKIYHTLLNVGEVKLVPTYILRISPMIKKTVNSLITAPTANRNLIVRTVTKDIRKKIENELQSEHQFLQKNLKLSQAHALILNLLTPAKNAKILSNWSRTLVSVKELGEIPSILDEWMEMTFAHLLKFYKSRSTNAQQQVINHTEWIWFDAYLQSLPPVRNYGIFYTANPWPTRLEDECVIYAALGETFFKKKQQFNHNNGNKHDDAYEKWVIDPKNGRIKYFYPLKKEKKVITDNSSEKTPSITEKTGLRQILTPLEIQVLYNSIKQIQQSFGVPLKVKWIITKKSTFNLLYILPIQHIDTTFLGKTQSFRPCNLVKKFPLIPDTLSFSLFSTAIMKAFQKILFAFNIKDFLTGEPLFIEFYKRYYWNVQILAQYLNFKTQTRKLNPKKGTTILKKTLQRLRIHFPSLYDLLWISEILQANLSTTEKLKLKHWTQELVRINHYSNLIIQNRLLYAELPDAELYLLLKKFWLQTQEILNSFLLVFLLFSLSFLSLIEKLQSLEKNAKWEQQIDYLYLILDENKETIFEKVFNDLENLIAITYRFEEVFNEIIKINEVKMIPEILSKSFDGRTILLAWQEYVFHYRWLADVIEDITQPRWDENPIISLNTFSQRLLTGVKGIKHLQQKQRTNKIRKEWETLQKNLENLPLVKKLVLKKHLLELREITKNWLYEFSKAYEIIGHYTYELRNILLEITERWYVRGIIGDLQDLLYLKPKVLIQFIDGQLSIEEFQRIIEEEKTYFHLYNNWIPPCNEFSKEKESNVHES